MPDEVEKIALSPGEIPLSVPSIASTLMRREGKRELAACLMGMPRVPSRRDIVDQKMRTGTNGCLAREITTPRTPRSSLTAFCLAASHPAQWAIAPGGAANFNSGNNRGWASATRAISASEDRCEHGQAHDALLEPQRRFQAAFDAGVFGQRRLQMSRKRIMQPSRCPPWPNVREEHRACRLDDKEMKRVLGAGPLHRQSTRHAGQASDTTVPLGRRACTSACNPCIRRSDRRPAIRPTARQRPWGISAIAAWSSRNPELSDEIDAIRATRHRTAVADAPKFSCR